MTGHDLYPPTPEARAFIETAEILAEPYNEVIADLRAKLAVAEQERDDQTWRADVADALCAAARRDKERAEARLAAAEQERDNAVQAAECNHLAKIEQFHRADRAEAALAAVRELADLYDEDRDRTTGQSVASSICNYIRRALAAAEQDEPKRPNCDGSLTTGSSVEQRDVRQHSTGGQK